MTARTFVLRAGDGADLHSYCWRPDGEPRGVVTIAHGMAEHAGRYARFAERLVEAGFAVYAHDHRGHGGTAPDEASLGHFADRDGWTQVIADLRGLVAYARGAHPAAPAVLLGHSMGAIMAQHVMLFHPGDADLVILSGSSLVTAPQATAGRLLARFLCWRQGPRARSALLARLSFGRFNRGLEGRTPFDWLSRDPQEVDRYVADPRCGFQMTNQAWVDLLGGLVAIGRGDWGQVREALPVCLIAGEDDPVGNRGRGVRALADRIRAGGRARVTVRLFPGGRHEMLNEINRDEVIADLVRWLDRHLGQP